jgi:hypothetical protein
MRPDAEVRMTPPSVQDLRECCDVEADHQICALYAIAIQLAAINDNLNAIRQALLLGGDPRR